MKTVASFIYSISNAYMKEIKNLINRLELVWGLCLQHPQVSLVLPWEVDSLKIRVFRFLNFEHISDLSPNFDEDHISNFVFNINL